MAYVTYVAVEGLANRLRTHMLAKAYALRTGRTLAINWAIVKAFGANYTDLFVLGDGEVEVRSLGLRSYDYWLRGRRTLRINGLIEETVERLPVPRISTVEFGEAAHPWCYENDGAVLGNFKKVAAASLRPRYELAKRIDGLIGHLRCEPIGIHIRRGDFELSFPSTQYGVETWRRVIAKIKSRWQGCPIYVASDDPAFARNVAEGESSLLMQVKKVRDPSIPDAMTVFGYDNRCNRDQICGAEEAVIDFMALSRCRAVYGLRESSFARLAAFMGGADFIVVNELLRES